MWDPGFTIVLIILAGFLSLIRSYRVENYLRLCDNQDKISFIKHISRFLSSYVEFKQLVAFWLPIPILKNENHESERRIINFITIFIYISIVIVILIINL